MISKQLKNKKMYVRTYLPRILITANAAKALSAVRGPLEGMRE